MSQTNKPEIVVLLHGIGHNKIFMMATEKVLESKGYETLNITYPSLRQNISNLSKWLSKQLMQNKIWEKASKVHFVVHSMGGLVSGTYLDEFRNQIPQDKMGRVVMLGTPHGGSEVADFLQKNPLYQWAFGPAGQELTTEIRQEKKIKPWYELGIIAGAPDKTFTIGQFFIDTEHDGCVSVESTKVDGMTAHKTMPVLHSFMAWMPDVQKQVVHFLKEGTFE